MTIAAPSVRFPYCSLSSSTPRCRDRRVCVCVCFDDVYLNADWQVSAKCPPKTCYLRIRYPHYYDYDNTVQQYPDISVDKLRSILRVFLESVYFDNEHAFQIKLCFMKAAFHKTCASKVLFLVGKGGSGKGMEAVLAKALFGRMQAPHWIAKCSWIAPDCGNRPSYPGTKRTCACKRWTRSLVSLLTYGKDTS